MTDRIHSLTVTLERDFRTDDIEMLSNAIRMLKGVIAVTEHVADATSYMAEARARRELTQKIMDIIQPIDL
jgi:hypothetical protein